MLQADTDVAVPPLAAAGAAVRSSRSGSSSSSSQNNSAPCPRTSFMSMKRLSKVCGTKGKQSKDVAQSLPDICRSTAAVQLLCLHEKSPASRS